MSKKRKELADFLSENELALRVRDSAQQIWLAGLGAYGITREEGGKVISTLIKEGEIVQARALKLTDRKMAVVAGKASEALGRLEQIFDDGVARTLDRLGVPSTRDIDKLSKSVHELRAIVEELAETKTALPRVANPIAVPTALAKQESAMTEPA